jgi:hypothetical protein
MVIGHGLISSAARPGTRRGFTVQSSTSLPDRIPPIASIRREAAGRYRFIARAIRCFAFWRNALS